MQIHDALHIIWARRGVVIAVFLAGVIATFVGMKIAGPTYSATATVLMNAGGGSLGTTISDGGFLGSDMPTLLESDTVLSRFVQQMQLENQEYKDIRRHIEAEIEPESGVMPISYKARTAHDAIAGANYLADDLRDYYREISTQRYDDLAGYLSTALNGERAKIEATERELDHLVASDPYFTQSQAAQAIGAQLLALQQQRDQVEATMESSAVGAQLAAQRIQDLRPTILSELQVADPDYNALATQIAKDRTSETLLRAQYTDKYGGIKSLEDQIARSNATLQTERKRVDAENPGASQTYGLLLRDRDTAQAVYSGDQAQLAAIERQIASTESHLAKLPEIGVRVSTLQRDRDAANTAYQILAEQRTLTLSEQAQIAAMGSVTVADRASFAESALGKGALLLLSASILAFTILALAIPFVLEMIDQRLRRRVTIETLYGRPLIGTVPA